MRKLFIVLMLGLAVLAAIGLSSCGGGSGSSGGSTSSEEGRGTTATEGSDGAGSAEGDQEDKTLAITYGSFPDYMDPQLSYGIGGWTAMGEVYIPLLTYRHGEEADGSEVVPGLAKEMPHITNGGKTYTLFLRPGLRYSNGKPVKASDFPYAVERMFRLNSGGTYFYTSIIGARKFAATKRGGIPGIKTNDRTGEIQITLEKPRGTFNNDLALMFVAPVPRGTPTEDLSANPPPATGPYMLKHVKPGSGWDYERNPQWKINSTLMPEYPTGHVGSATVKIVRDPQTQVNDIEQGKYQWMQTPVPASRFANVKEQFAGTQFKINPSPSTSYFWMNTRIAPFDNLKVRQAVNYAIDPRALERIYSGQIKSSQQILPPGMPGYSKFELYPHNIDKAKELIKEANPSDKDISVWTADESPPKEVGEYYAAVLDDLGFNTTLKVINKGSYDTIIGNESTPDLDTGWNEWLEDYSHPNDFFQPLLTTESILPTNSNNFSRYGNPKWDKEITKLGEEQLGPEQEAAYEKLDEEIMNEAPWAPFGNVTRDTFVSDAIDLDGVINSPIFLQYLTSFEFNE